MCPGCRGYTSGIAQAFAEGEPCPSCGLPADVADAVERARDRKATADVADQLLAAEQRAIKAEREASALRRALAEIRTALGRCLCGAGFDSNFGRYELKHEPGCPQAREAP